MRLAVGIVLLLAGAALQGQSVPSTVTLDVVVDGGAGSKPLAAGDFSVADADGPLTIESVQNGPATTGAAAEPLPPILSAADEQAAAARASRVVGIFVDDTTWRPATHWRPRAKRWRRSSGAPSAPAISSSSSSRSIH